MLAATRLGFTLPADLVLQGVARFPYELRGDTTRFRFDRHATLGVILDSVGIDGGTGTLTGTGTGPFEFVTHSEAVGTDRDLGLWQLHVDRQSPAGQELLKITPADTAVAPVAHRVRTTSGGTGLLLIWRRIRVQAWLERETSFFVAQLITVQPGEDLARWTTWVGRERGAGVSIEAVESPSIHVRGPIAPRRGESHLAAQRRARLLIPVAANFVVGLRDAVTHGLATTNLLNGVNWPLYYWSAFGVKNLLPHPNHQQQQFQAVYAADGTDHASFRRLMYFATEDTTGQIKNFHHEGYRVETRDGPEGWYNFRAQYVPGYEDALSDEPAKPRTRFGNTFVTPYATVVGPMLARTDEFWFDVTATYRDWVEASGMWGSRVVDDPDRGALTHYAPLVGCIDERNAPIAAGEAVWTDYLRAARTVRRGLDPHGTTTPLVYLHSQGVRKDGISAHNPDDPLSETVDPWASITMRRALPEGIVTSVYMRPYDTHFRFTPNWAEQLPLAARGYGRDGGLAKGVIFLPDRFTTNVQPDGYILDYGSPAAQNWYLDNLYGPLMETYGMRGAYTDLFGGHGASPFYDPPPPAEPTHVAHGGDYIMQGKRKTVTAIREFMKGLAARRGEDPRIYFLGAEGAEEFLADKYDWANAGYGYYGNHLMFAEDVALRWLAEYTGDPDPEDAYDGVPAVSRNMSPPLWNMVHHEWAPGQRSVVPWSNVGLATNRQFYPAAHHVPLADDYTGIPPEKFIDLYCFTSAMLINEGVRPSQFIFRRDVDDRLGYVYAGLWDLDGAGNPTVDVLNDPTGAGLALRAFYEKLHLAVHEGPLREFVLYGRMERSLEIDYERGDVELRTNPMFWMFGQESPFEFHAEGLFLYGRYVDPGPVQKPRKRLPGLFSVSPYPTTHFTGTTYLPGLLSHEVPAVFHSVWRSVSNGLLGIALVNWTGATTSIKARILLDEYGLDPVAGFRIRVYRWTTPATDWLGPHHGGSELAAVSRHGDVQIPDLPPRSLTLLLIQDGRQPLPPNGL